MTKHVRTDAFGEPCPAHVLLALSTAHDNLMPVEIDVLDAQCEAVLDPEPRAVEDDDDDPDLTGQLFQNAADFIAAEHNRHPNRQAGPRHLVELAGFNAEHVLVQ